MEEDRLRGAERSLRVLIVRIGALGDVLHALPAVAALRERHPEWTIDWAIEPVWSELLEARGSDSKQQRGAARPLVDLWSPVPTREWKKKPLSLQTLREIAAMSNNLRHGEYDLCVDMQGAIRSAVVGRLAGAGKFSGPAVPRERPAEWLYGQRIPVTTAHVVEQGCELVGAAVGETLHPAKVSLPIDEAAERWCDEVVAATGGPFVMMAPTAGWGAKVWPAERYGAVAAELARAGYSTLVNSASMEDETGSRVVEASRGAAKLIPCSIGQMIALVRRSALMIAGDTGPLHLAAALERPVVGLYGPTDPARNGPYGTRSRVLRHGSSRRDHTRKAETEAGLLRITSGEVIMAALELLKPPPNAEQDKVKE